MKNSAVWAAFLAMCFFVVGIAGQFGTFAPLVPYQAALQRSAVLDQALVAGQGPDGAARLEAMRRTLGRSAAAVLDGPGTVTERVAAARATMLDEQTREANSVARRTRIMVLTISLMGTALGVGVLLFALKQSQVKAR